MEYSRTPRTMQEFDRRVEAQGIASLDALMRQAGSHVAFAAKRLVQARGEANRALLLVGKGNNGGDALFAAQLLHQRGWQLQLLLATPPEEFGPAPLVMWRELPEALRKTAHVATPELQTLEAQDALVIDGLLGTGFNGDLPREPIATLLRLANASKRPILAIDLPSGLNGETGKASLCINATATICLAAVKTGLLQNAGIDCAGRLLLAELSGMELLDDLPKGPAVCGLKTARTLRPELAFSAHKFTRGMVTILGGSAQYCGAPILAGTAALYAGAGLTQVCLPENCQPCCKIPQALILRRLSATPEGTYHPKTLPELPKILDKSCALAIGPGLTKSPTLLPLLAEAIGFDLPMVLDADALNLLATCPALLQARSASSQTVLTPHDGEFARLQQALALPKFTDRLQETLALSQKTNAVVVRKGARTIVASPDGQCSYNLSGCPALATAGSGDVLTGLVAAFLANGLTGYDAARLAVWLHGQAAEEATRPGAPCGLIADDLPRLVASSLAKLY